MALNRFFSCFLFTLALGIPCITSAETISPLRTKQPQLSPQIKAPISRPVLKDTNNRPCNMTSTNIPAQAINGEVIINGTNLSDQCMVSFSTPYATGYPTPKILLTSPTSLKVWVPKLNNGGIGTINMKAPGNQYPEIQLPFMVVEGQGPACEIRNVSPNAAAVNGDVTIDGMNLGSLCTVAFKDSTGKQLDATVTYAGPRTMKVKVPATAAAGSAGIYTKVKGSSGPGFGPWTFKIISGTACETTSLSKNNAQPGDSITVNGNNIMGSCAVIIDDSTQKRFTVPVSQPLNGSSTTIKLPTGLAAGPAVVAMINQSGPQSGPTSGPRGFPLQINPGKCEITSVTPAYAPARAFVILKGNMLDQNCAVYIKSSPNGPTVQAYTTEDKDGFKAQIPTELLPGKGTIESRPAGGQKTPGREVPFEVVIATPILKSLSPIAALPGTNRITVQGSNFDYLASSKAIIEIQNGEKLEVPTGNNNATKFDLMVIPDIYKGLNVTVKNAEHRQKIMQPKLLFIKKEQIESNRLLLNIRSPYPILDQLSKTTVYPGDTIVVYGGNWEFAKLQSYNVNLHLPSGTIQTKPVPMAPVGQQVQILNLPNISLTGMFYIKIPDVFANKSAAEQDAINRGTVQLSIFGPDTMSSNKLDINIRKRPVVTGFDSSCPGAKYFTGYTYMGQPSCSGSSVLGAYLQCDKSGYYCNSSSGRFPAACTQWGSGAGSNVGPLIVDGVFYGCYKSP